MFVERQSSISMMAAPPLVTDNCSFFWYRDLVIGFPLYEAEIKHVSQLLLELLVNHLPSNIPVTMLLTDP